MMDRIETSYRNLSIPSSLPSGPHIYQTSKFSCTNRVVFPRALEFSERQEICLKPRLIADVCAIEYAYSFYSGDFGNFISKFSNLRNKQRQFGIAYVSLSFNSFFFHFLENVEQRCDFSVRVCNIRYV